MSHAQMSSSSQRMQLNICNDVIRHSLKQLQDLQRSLSCLVNLTVDHANSAEMVFTTTFTYLRTCKQALDEAGENSHGPFCYTISMLNALEADECTSSQVISQAIIGMIVEVSHAWGT